MQVLAIYIGTPGRERVARRSEPAGHPDDLCVLQRSREKAIRGRPLCHSNVNARLVNFVCRAQRATRTGYVAVVDLHEHVTEAKVLCTSGITCGKADVPFAFAQALIVSRR